MSKSRKMNAENIIKNTPHKYWNSWLPSLGLERIRLHFLKFSEQFGILASFWDRFGTNLACKVSGISGLVVGDLFFICVVFLGVRWYSRSVFNVYILCIYIYVYKYVLYIYSQVFIFYSKQLLRDLQELRELHKLQILVIFIMLVMQVFIKIIIIMLIIHNTIMYIILRSVHDAHISQNTHNNPLNYQNTNNIQTYLYTHLLQFMLFVQIVPIN